MIISVHIPKTGGTTFLDFLFKNFSKNIVSDYYDLKSLKDDKILKNITPETDIIHTHYRADKYDKLYPEAKLLIWLRNPIDRYLSLYYDFLRRPNHKNKHCNLLHKHNYNFEEFYKNTKADSIKDFMGKKTLSDFAFIGITERYNDSINLFCNMFKIKNVIYPKPLNTNPNKKFEKKYTISPKTIKYLKIILKEDILLYKEANNLFRKSLNL